MNAINKPQSLASIKFLKGPLTGDTFQIDKPITSIGRDPGNDIVIEEDLHVAKYHARLLWNHGSWSIQKHPQASSITINAQNVQQADISNNTTVVLGGDTTFLFLVNAEANELSNDTLQMITLTPALDAVETSPSLAQVHNPTGLIARPFGTEIAPFAALGVPTLEVTSNTFLAKKSYPLVKDVINIGRDARMIS